VDLLSTTKIQNGKRKKRKRGKGRKGGEKKKGRRKRTISLFYM